MSDDPAAPDYPTAPAEFERLSNGRPSLDGTKVAFTIECRGDESADIACAIADIPRIISYLVELAVAAKEQSDSVAPAPKSGQQVLFDPMQALGFGFVPGRSAEETFLVVRTAAFELTFSVPSSGLARLAPELAQIGSTLSAGGAKQ